MGGYSLRVVLRSSVVVGLAFVIRLGAVVAAALYPHNPIAGEPRLRRRPIPPKRVIAQRNHLLKRIRKGLARAGERPTSVLVGRRLPIPQQVHGF